MYKKNSIPTIQHMKGTHSESDNCAVQKYKPPVVGKALQTLIDVSLNIFPYSISPTFC